MAPLTHKMDVPLYSLFVVSKRYNSILRVNIALEFGTCDKSCDIVTVDARNVDSLR